MNPTATLNALQAAEARIAGTIQQTALAVDGIGANTQQALAQLAVALDNARARLAVDLTTFAEMMGEAFVSFEAAANLIAAPLAIPAPVLPALPKKQLSDLDQPSAGQAVSDPDGKGRQEAQTVEGTQEPSEGRIAAQPQPQAREAAFVADALASLASMPEVSRMACCVHNGVGVPACDACAARAAAFVPPVAANNPVEHNRDERKPAERKRRAKPS